MATREITKRNPDYDDPQLERELVIETENAGPHHRRGIARLALLWKNRRFLFRCTVVGFVASSLLVLLIPVRFTSITRLMPPDQAGAGMASMLAALGKAGTELGAIGSELLGLRTSSDLFIGILRSRTVQNQLVEEFDLRKVYGAKQWDDARKMLEKRTEITSDRKSGIITISVSDHDPKRAADLARAYVAALNQVVLTLNTSAAHKERAFLEQRLDQVQKDLEIAERNFGDFASKNTALDVKEQGRAMLGAAAQVEGQLIAAQTELEGLKQIYTENNVRVRQLEARVQEFQHQLQRLGGKPESAESPSTSTSDIYPAIRQLPILGITYADLYRKAKVQEAVFETLTKQYELAKVEEARETPSVKVLDEGDIPERKSFPPRTMFVAFATMLIFGFASLIVLAYARWERVDPTDPGKVLALEIYRTVRNKSLPFSFGTSRLEKARKTISQWFQIRNEDN